MVHDQTDPDNGSKPTIEDKDGFFHDTDEMMLNLFYFLLPLFGEVVASDGLIPVCRKFI